MRVGADIEAFVVDSASNYPLSAIGMLGGTKESPVDIGNGFAVQEDNVTCEWNVPPASSPDEFIDIIRRGKIVVEEYVRSRYSEQVHLLYQDSMTFPTFLLDNPTARRFGCVPELDAYSRGAAFPSPDAATTNERFAGFHIHFGFGPGEFNLPGFAAAPLLEALIVHRSAYGRQLLSGLSSYALTRKQFYGRAGAYRDTRYPNGDIGIEFRVMGSEVGSQLELLREVIGAVWDDFARLCRDEELSASLYHELNLAHIQARKRSRANADAIINHLGKKVAR